MKIDRKQLAVSMLTCRTIDEICQKHKISISTFYRIRQEPGFSEMVNKEKEKLYLQAMIIAQAATLEAIETLRNIHLDTKNPPSARVSAAGKIIETGQAAFDAAEIMERVAEVERRLSDAEALSKFAVIKRSAG